MAAPSSSAQPKRLTAKQRGLKIGQYAARLIHPQKQTELDRDLKSEVKDVCIQVNKVWEDVQILRAALSDFDKLLMDLHHKDHGFQRQMFERMQHSLVKPAENAKDNLQFLVKMVEDLESRARSTRPELCQDILILKEVASQRLTYVHAFVIHPFGSKIRVEIYLRRQKPEVDRHRRLPERQPEGAILSDWTIIKQRAEPDRGSDIGDDHPFSRPIKDLYEEYIDILTEDSRLFRANLQIRYPDLLNMVPDQQEAAWNTWLALARDFMPQVLALQQRLELFNSYRQKLREVYEAGPRSADLDNILWRYDNKLELSAERVDVYVERFREDLEVPDATRPAEVHEYWLAAAREVTILGTCKMSLRPSDEFFATLKQVDFVCKSVGDEKHHFWYKGLHSMSDEFHAASHRIRDIIKANESVKKSPKAFFGGATPTTWKSHAREIAKFEESFMELVKVYDSKPELTFLQLDNEVFELASCAVGERKKAEQMLIRGNGKAGDDSDVGDA